MAQCNLANCYYNGQGVPQSYADAVKWYLKAAEQGYAKAQCNLGDCFFKGYGVFRNLDEARRWYRLAADNGNQTAQEALRKYF